MASFHCCGTSPPLQIRTTISSSLRRSAGSPLRVILNNSTETPSGPTAFRSPTSGWRLSAPISWTKLLVACFRVTGQGLLRCSGQASVTCVEYSVEPPDPSFADEFNVPQQYEVLVFDVRRAAVSLPFQVHRLKVRVEAGLVALTTAYDPT